MRPRRFTTLTRAARGRGLGHASRSVTFGRRPASKNRLWIGPHVSATASGTRGSSGDGADGRAPAVEQAPAGQAQVALDGAAEAVAAGHAPRRAMAWTSGAHPPDPSSLSGSRSPASGQSGGPPGMQDATVTASASPSRRIRTASRSRIDRTQAATVVVARASHVRTAARMHPLLRRRTQRRAWLRRRSRPSLTHSGAPVAASRTSAPPRASRLDKGILERKGTTSASKSLPVIASNAS